MWHKRHKTTASRDSSATKLYKCRRRWWSANPLSSKITQETGSAMRLSLNELQVPFFWSFRRPPFSSFSVSVPVVPFPFRGTTVAISVSVTFASDKQKYNSCYEISLTWCFFSKHTQCIPLQHSNDQILI